MVVRAVDVENTVLVRVGEGRGMGARSPKLVAFLTGSDWAGAGRRESWKGGEYANGFPNKSFHRLPRARPARQAVGRHVCPGAWQTMGDSPRRVGSTARWVDPILKMQWDRAGPQGEWE